MMSDPRPDNPFRLRDSFVCFADIIGWGDEIKKATKEGRGNEHLQRCLKIMMDAADEARAKAKINPQLPHWFKVGVFSDSIIVGLPSGAVIRDAGYAIGAYNPAH